MSVNPDRVLVELGPENVVVKFWIRILVLNDVPPVGSHFLVIEQVFRTVARAVKHIVLIQG